MKRTVRKAGHAMQRSLRGKIIVAAVLIAAGLVASTLGDSASSSLLIMAGLTLGGWSTGLHTQVPSDDEEMGDE